MARERSNYTPEQRKHALTLVAEHGIAEAYRRTAIPKSCLSRWASAAGIATLPSKTEHATDARRLSWEQRREALTAEMGDAVADALRLVKRGLRDGIQGSEASISTADLKNYATVAAIFVDKAQLLTGGATDRRETMGVDPRDRVEQVRDELAARRRGAA